MDPDTVFRRRCRALSAVGNPRPVEADDPLEAPVDDRARRSRLPRFGLGVVVAVTGGRTLIPSACGTAPASVTEPLLRSDEVRSAGSTLMADLIGKTRSGGSRPNWRSEEVLHDEIHVGEQVAFESSPTPELLGSPGVVALVDQTSWSSSLPTLGLEVWGGGWPTDCVASSTDSILIAALMRTRRGSLSYPV
jgi:hypothetical protein